MPSRTAPVSSAHRRWVEGLLIVAFWTLLAALLVGSYVLDGRRGMPGAGFVVYEFIQAYLWAALTPLVFWATRRYSVERTNWHRRISMHLGLGLIISLAVDVVENVNLRYVAQPSWADQLSFSPLEAFLELDFLDDLLIYLAILAAGFARDYFLRYQERRAHADRLQAQLTRARLEALRMQIHPHFFFNTLHAISSLVERDPQRVRRIIARLSDLLRYTLDDENGQEVPLRKELQFLDGYLDIQRIRFPDRLAVEKEVASDTLDALIPSLILQPLVENAIKHGVSGRRGEGTIILRARRSRDMLVLEVQDNGPGLTDPDDAAPHREGIGLSNVEARLQEMYGERAAVRLRNVENGGLLARISLPYHTSEDLHTASAEHMQ